MAKTIYLVTGLSDVEIAGNPSLENCIKYLSKFGYKILVFTFMPKNYQNLEDPKKIFHSNVDFYRLPNILTRVFNFGKKVKDFIGKRDPYPFERTLITSSEIPGTYIREYNTIGRLLYIAFLFTVYLPIELFRTLIHSIKNRPDIIYGVNCQGAVAASILSRLIKRPVITRFHGASITEHDLNHWRSRVLVFDEIMGLKAKSNAVIMTNDGTKGDKILRMLSVEASKIVFCMNGLDTDDFILPVFWNKYDLKEKLNIKSKRVLLMNSRLATWKGVSKGISCVQKLVKEYKISDLILLVVGDGPERRNLEYLSQKLGIKEFIHFVGSVPHKEIAKYYTIADIFLSLYDLSNLGNPVLEALFFGIPIITINDGSTEHLLKDSYNSLLVNIENLENELPLKTKVLLEDKTLRATISRGAKETFMEKIFSWEERMRLEERVINEILKEGKLKGAIYGAKN